MMNIYIPIANVTLTDGQTYDGQLPVWATRPLMVKVTTGTNEPVNIAVRDGGSSVKTVTLPYQQNGMDVDLSFAAPLLKRADRNKSQGTPWFMQQKLAFWTSNSGSPIIIPVFHCDLTYWDTLGVDAALPQPPKPRIPGQTLDIFFPYVIHPYDALFLEVEPVTGAPSNVIFPATYVLGNTIDITYIKKLTIKNVWGNGLDQVINYEDRLMSDAVYDTGLQCALRARWNMRNGQWFWAAFKDYFWSNKFTPIRGRGGVTEQAEITINLEYSEEWYNVYQELLVSSNVVFDLNIPGINQYHSKRFRAEVVGDTGARWSNSTKTYRQQVRFRTTELQDNYMSPLAPDQPPTPSIVFTAQKNPWMISAAYAEGLVNSIYSNVAWKVQSTPSWLSVDNLTGSAGTTPLTVTVAANTGNARTGNIVLKSLVGSTTYNIAVTQAGATGNITVDTPTFNIDYLTHPVTMNVTSVGTWSISQKDSWITPSVTAGPNGTTTVTLTIGDNLPAGASARTGTIKFQNDLTGEIATVTINQGGAPTSIKILPSRVSGPKAGGDQIALAAATSGNAWIMGSAPSWVSILPTSGEAGQTAIAVKYDTANPGAARTGQLRLENTTTHEIAICLITQEG
jgi:hypothetical protein|nr:MAG TPA_asm: hypothetical protein [Caudoviricetes sp.]